jgi:ABC-type transport system involved in cytochrome c biogenesis ATPase subunit
MMRTIPVLDVQHLRKTYGPLVAVEDVSFTIEAGQLVGLLGPNGAGTTTTVSMIAGLVTPERGEVRVGGSRLHGDTDPAKRPIGLVPQDLALYDELSGRDNLPFFGALYGLSGRALAGAMAAALELVGLADRAGDAVKSYSGGTKRRLNRDGLDLRRPRRRSREHAGHGARRHHPGGADDGDARRLGPDLHLPALAAAAHVDRAGAVGGRRARCDDVARHRRGRRRRAPQWS